MTGSNSQCVLSAILRKDLEAFIAKVFATVSPGDSYKRNWHIGAVAYELERCWRGETTRLLINQPPRSLKSICSSVAFVAWALGHDPKKRFICVSYSQDLAVELNRQFRAVVQSDWYRRLFPNTCFAKSTADECTTTKGGGRIATSIGGTLTGRGADIIIIDDPLKAEDAQSDIARKAVIDWFSSTLITRLNNKDSGAIIIVMQRLHEEDLCGHVLAEGDWCHLNLPAIAIEDQKIRVGPNLHNIYHRQQGDILHPDHESTASLERTKAEIGSMAFSAQYQQEPIPRDGNLVKREWFQKYQGTPWKEKSAQIVQSWDVAGTTTERSDYSVCTTWAIVGKSYYLIDVWRGRLETPNLRRKIIDLQRMHGARTVLIEKSGLGLSLYQDLRQDSPPDFPNPIGISPTTDKVNRMSMQSARIEGGQVYLPEEAPWLAGYLNELLGFPHAKHDDQVDSTSQFLNWAVNRNRLDPLAGCGGFLICEDGRRIGDTGDDDAIYD